MEVVYATGDMFTVPEGRGPMSGVWIAGSFDGYGNEMRIVVCAVVGNVTVDESCGGDCCVTEHVWVGMTEADTRERRKHGPT